MKKSGRKNQKGMGEIKATGQYLKTLKDVYKEKGFLAAVRYELESFKGSLGWRLYNLADIKGDTEREYDMAMRRYRQTGADADKPSEILRKLATEFKEARKRRKVARDVERRKYILRHREGDLEQTAATAAIIGIIGAIFFLSANMTGNVIGVSNSTSNIIGALFLIVAIVAGFFWVRGRK